MARYVVVKGSVGPWNLWLYKFTRDLVSCVDHACKEIAREISRQPDASFGTEARIAKASTTTAGTAATSFSTGLVAPHSNAYARHFMSVNGRTTRMDLGNLVEQRAIERLRSHYTGWRENVHYLYQRSNAIPPRFPVNYTGASKSARPDIRYEFYSGQAGGDEAVFDITTPAQAGHLLHKSIGATPISRHARIPVAVEVIWEDADLYNA